MTKVFVDYCTYYVYAGPDVNEGPSTDLVPGVVSGLGRQGVAVLTGLQYGDVSVGAAALAARPEQVEPGWDVVAEVDLDCPEGDIAVCDWGGPDHPELGPLAITGPGRYRLRVHARNRDAVEEKDSREEHYLQTWPVTEPSPPALLTPLDEFGRLFTGEECPESEELDEVDLAIRQAILRLAELCDQPPPLSGRLTTLRFEASISSIPRRVWNLVTPFGPWIGMVGGPRSEELPQFRERPGPWLFKGTISNEPELNAWGDFLVDDPPRHVAFTWQWNRGFRDEDGFVPVYRPDLAETILDLVAPQMFPATPTVVDIELRRQGKGATHVTLEHQQLPVELAEDARSIWTWCLRNLERRFTDE